MFQKISAALYNLVRGTFFFERRCSCCLNPYLPQSNSSSTTLLCPRCAPFLLPTQGCYCHLCGKAIIDAEIHPTVCPVCSANPPPWNRLYFFSHYAGLFKHLILQYKYSQDFSIAPLLAQCLQVACQQLPPCDIMVPMPRHPKRLAERGFNQVQEICRPLTKALHIPLQPTSLQRSKHTQPQASLSAQQRQQNPAGSFMASDVLNKSVLLVDDIITTGATLQHACGAFQKAGTCQIYFAVLARA